MGMSIFDFVVLSVFVFVQWRITLLLLRASARRWIGVRLMDARAAVFTGDLVLLFGYLLSFGQWFTWIRLPRRMDAWVEGAALMYLASASGAVILRAIIRFAGRHWTRDADPGRRKVLRMASNAAVVTPAAVLGYGMFIERVNLQVREVDLPIEGLPEDLNGLRILQVSDIHRGPFLSERELGRVIDAALEVRPHLAVVTGDLISSYGDPLDACIRQLARLKADAGVFGCMGNHERYAEAERHTEIAAGRAGIPFLRSAARKLRFGSATLNLAGGDYQTKRQPYLEGAERLMEPGAFNL